MLIEFAEPVQTNINSNIFNANKTDYGNSSLFLGQDMGLLDTVNRSHEDLFNLYKKLKSLDWDELEFDYQDCAVDFEQATPAEYIALMRNLGWQWETDTSAARALPVIFSAFITSSDLFPLTTRIIDNEVIHALTYSEIVKQCFKNSAEIIDDITSVKESLQRLETVGKIFSDTYEAALRILTGESTREIEHKHIVLFYCALYCLERIQFTSSFGITFALCNGGRWNPIGKAVQKIAQDELEIHSVHGRKVLSKLMNTKEGMDVIVEQRPVIQKLIDEVLQSEFAWVDFNTVDGHVVGEFKPKEFKDFSILAAKPVYELFYMDCPHEYPTYNPLPFMSKWIDINSFQAAAQEERSGAYMLGMITKDLKTVDDFGYNF